jgi:type IV pilus assembly protein PilQ
MRTRQFPFALLALFVCLPASSHLRAQPAPTADASATAPAPAAPAAVAEPAAPVATPPAPAEAATPAEVPVAAPVAVAVEAAAPAVTPAAPVAVAAAVPAPTPAVAPAAASSGAAATPAAAPAKSKDSSGRDTLSVDFPDEDVRNILRNVADLFELNIIMPESLQGKTTIKLRDVTWRQIFQSVLDPVGYTYVEEGNIIKIIAKDTLNEEPVTTDVFIINYARAGDILPTISSLVDNTKGKIVVDSRSNSLVITERPTRLSRIKPIIEQLDRATDQVMIESKFVEVTDSDVKNIGVNWASLQNYGLGVSKMSSTFDRTRGQNSTNGVDSTNGTTDTSSKSTTQQVGSNTSVTNTVTNGVSTNTSVTGNTGSTTNVTTGTVGGNNALTFLNNVANSGGTSREVTALFSADEFRVVLSALQTQGDVKIVSNPTVVTLNNTEATINVGDSQPIPNYAFNQQTGSFEVNGFTYKDIGIILKVTPQVNARGFIKLTLSPEVSQQNGVRKFGEAELPIIATRKAVTQVSLKDGYTMGIGGLLSTQTTKGVSKVPVLGSLPVMGRLFRSDTKEEHVTNLIIFITAKTVSADGAPVEQVFESGRVRQLGLHKEDMPGYRDGSTPYVTDPPPPEPKKAKKAKSTKSTDGK